MSVLYHLGKDNVVADALSWISIGSVAHVDHSMNELVKYVHRLDRYDVLLEDSSKGGFLVHRNSESPLVV